MSDVVAWEPSYPYIPKNPRKRAFMSYRIAGHDVLEATILTGISRRTYFKWQQYDADFAYWNGTGLTQLRREQRDTLVGDTFLVNANLIQQLDRQALVAIQTKLSKGQQLTVAELSTLDKLRTTYASPNQHKAIKEFLDTGKAKNKSILDFFKEKNGMIIESSYREVTDETPHLPCLSSTSCEDA